MSVPNRLVVVQRADGSRTSFYATERSQYRFGSENGSLDNLRVGANVDVQYESRDGRDMIYSIGLADSGDANTPSDWPSAERDGNSRVRLRGRIAKLSPDANQIVLVGNDGQETVVMMDERQEVELMVEKRDGHFYLARIGLAASKSGERIQTKSTAEGTTVQGTIVRVMDRDNQFVLRTEAGEEIVLYGDPRSTIQIDNQTVPFNAIREGTQATVVYEPRGKNKVLRTLNSGIRRRAK